MSDAAIVVFCHLRWDFVFQRPQHLLTRLARRRRVVVIEEPVGGAGIAPVWERQRPQPGLEVWRLHLPGEAHGFSAGMLPHVAALARRLARGDGAPPLGDCIVWCYTPMACPLLDAFDPSTIVYDCMDELSLFHGAPPELLECERTLLERADVVFTGGPSLYRAKRDKHASVHCFPSSVDQQHFALARDARVPEPADQAGLPGPRLGFYGVIDERLDRDILDHVAAERPDWQLVMVGPVVKIDPASLPRRPNIHYFGQRAYQELPAFLGGWDVCLLPFAMNDATKFISPTKTLEYMAAERPIVSTPITDVAEPYGDIVYLGRTPEEFLAACDAALAAHATERARRVARMRTVLRRTSWDTTAAAMEQVLVEVRELKLGAERFAEAS